MTLNKDEPRSTEGQTNESRREAMSIAVDARMLRSSGIGTYLEAILSRMVTAHPEATFICHGNPAEIEKSPWSSLPNVKIMSWQIPVYSPRGMLSIPSTTSKRPDIAWFPHYVSPIYARAPRLITIHDVFPLAHPELMGGLSKVLAARWLFSNARRNARGLVFVSNYTASEFTRLVGKPRCPFSIIPNAVDDKWSIDQKEKSPHNCPYLVAVSNVKPHKNIGRLLEAFFLLPQTNGQLDLVVIGKRDGFINGDREIDKYVSKFQGRIHFTGRIDNNAVINYVSHAKALVFPSLYEGFGLPPLEAMAVGVPVIASNIPAIQEVCGDAVHYFNPYDIQSIANSMTTVLNGTSDRQNLIKRGYERVKYFSWNTSAIRTWNSLMAVLGKSII